MKLIFKQRMFSWLSQYDIFNEAGETVYTVKGQLSWGHCFKIFDGQGQEIGMVKSRIWTWQPIFDIYRRDAVVGTIRKEISFWKPKYTIDFRGWQVEGNWTEWDYTIRDGQGYEVARINKMLWKMTDTYVIDVVNASDALDALLLVLAIDAEKAARD